MKKPFLIGLILLIISIILIVLYICHKNTEFYYNDLYKFSSKQPTDLMIPKVIIQTYYDKSKIPNKIYKNIQKYAPEYNHIIYNDKECIEFLEQFDVTFKDVKKLNFNIVDRFKSFEKGAHKADLFRYCYLYQHGGIYLDIKTELIKPLKNIFTQNNTLYTVLSVITDSIYQGIIAVYPRNPIIGLLINQCAFYSDIKLTKNYHIFTKFFYKCILNNIKKSKISAGSHTINGYNIYFFKETKYEKSECDNKVDRYKLCSFINDEHNNKIFKTRYFDFPW